VRRRAIGIDFSGARDAGKRIWISEGSIDGRNRFNLEGCRPAFQRLNCSAKRDATLPALAEWIAERADAVIGCDFPFALPRCAVDELSWHDFVRSFERHGTADEFRSAMRLWHAGAVQKEPKRRTDLPEHAATPWNPWNIRLYRQTHAGIGSLLAPLVGRAAIAPFDRPADGRPLIVETCPASSLKQLGLYRTHGGYKGSGADRRRKRGQLADALCDLGLVAMSSALRSDIVADRGGDALDSVIAALGAIAALPEIALEVGYNEPIEGWVYYVRAPSARASSPKPAGSRTRHGTGSDTTSADGTGDAIGRANRTGSNDSSANERRNDRFTSNQRL
jgi:hypothetical protein